MMGEEQEGLGLTEEAVTPDKLRAAGWMPPAKVMELVDREVAKRDRMILDAIKAVRGQAADERAALHARGESLTDYSAGILDGIDKAWLAGVQSARRPPDERTHSSIEEWWACENAYAAGLAAAQDAVRDYARALVRAAITLDGETDAD